MQGTSRAPPTVVFTLRLWCEPLGNSQSEWRGEIKNLSTEEVRYFRQWEELSMLIPRMLYNKGEEQP